MPGDTIPWMMTLPRFLLLALLTVTLPRCLLPPSDARPIPGLDGVLIVTATPLPPPSPTPFAGTVVTLTPGDGSVDPEAEVIVGVTITDEAGKPLEGVVTIIWPEKGGRLDYGPRSEIWVYLQASGPFGGPHIFRVWAEGYVAQEWYFGGELSEDTAYRLPVRLAREP